MKKLIIGASVGLISTLSLGDVVKDILNTEVPQQNKEIQIINKFDIYQCGHDKNGSFDFRKWMTCLNTKSSVPSRFNYPDRTNDLYLILVKDYGLNTRVQCKIYSSDFGLSVDEKTKNLSNGMPIKHTDTSFKKFSIYPIYNVPKNFTLGSQVTANIKALPFSLWEDIDSDIKDVALLQHPDITDSQKSEIIRRFQNRHRFIEKSCGSEFSTAFNKYLNDYAKFSVEQFNNEQARLDEINQANQRKQQDKIIAQQENERQAIVNSERNKINQDRISQCKKGTPYKIYDLSNEIVNSYTWISRAEQNIKNDDARAKISGVSNLELRYKSATSIQTHQKRINELFKQYKSTGGSASEASLVKRINNPCT